MSGNKIKAAHTLEDIILLKTNNNSISSRTENAIKDRIKIMRNQSSAGEFKCRMGDVKKIIEREFENNYSVGQKITKIVDHYLNKPQDNNNSKLINTLKFLKNKTKKDIAITDELGLASNIKRNDVDEKNNKKAAAKIETGSHSDSHRESSFEVVHNSKVPLPEINNLSLLDDQSISSKPVDEDIEGIKHIIEHNDNESNIIDMVKSLIKKMKGSLSSDEFKSKLNELSMYLKYGCMKPYVSETIGVFIQNHVSSDSPDKNLFKLNKDKDKDKYKDKTIFEVILNNNRKKPECISDNKLKAVTAKIEIEYQKNNRDQFTAFTDQLKNFISRFTNGETCHKLTALVNTYSDRIDTLNYPLAEKAAPIGDTKNVITKAYASTQTELELKEASTQTEPVKKWYDSAIQFFRNKIASVMKLIGLHKG